MQGDLGANQSCSYEVGTPISVQIVNEVRGGIFVKVVI